MTKKRLIAEIDAEKFKNFKNICKELGVSMSTIVELGLQAGIAIYVQQKQKEIEMEKKKFNNFKNVSWVNDSDGTNGYIRNYDPATKGLKDDSTND